MLNDLARLPARLFPVVMCIVTAVSSTTPAIAADDVVAGMHALFAREWDRRMADNPTWASMLGDQRFNRSWPDLSAAAIASGQQATRAFLAELRAIDRAALPQSEQLNYDLFARMLEERVEAEPFKPWVYAINMRHGVQTADQLLESLRFTDDSDWQDWLARLQAFGTYMDQTIALLEEGAREGRTQPRVIIQRVPDQVRQQMVDDPAASPSTSRSCRCPGTCPSRSRRGCATMRRGRSPRSSCRRIAASSRFSRTATCRLRATRSGSPTPRMARPGTRIAPVTSRRRS